MDDRYGGSSAGDLRSGSSQGGRSPLCAAIEPLLYGFRTQTLDRSQMMQVAQHVATCPHCSRLVQQLDASLRAQQPPSSRGRPSSFSPGLVASWGDSPDASDPYGSAGTGLAPSQQEPYSTYVGGERQPFGTPQDTPHWPPIGPKGSGPAGKKPLPEFLRPPLVYYTGGAALCGLMALTFIIISLPLLVARGTTTQPTTAIATVAPSPTATSVPVPHFNLPAFSDWRAAYIADDGKVHIAALDGSSSIVGPAMSVNASDTLGGVSSYQTAGILIQAVAVSPDGHTLAYINQPPQAQGVGIAPPTGPIEIVPLAGGAAHAADGQANDVFWSPDGTQLAFDGQVGNQPGIYIVDAASGNATVVPHTDNTVLPSKHLLGWIDSTHLAVLTYQGGYAFPPLPTPTASPSPATTPSGTPSPSAIGQAPGPSNEAASGTPSHLFASRLSSESNAVITLNVQTGAANLLVNSADSSTLFTLSPDGKTLLMSSLAAACSPGPCGPQDQGGAALINTSTGEKQFLPNSSTLVPSLGTFVWSPDSLAVAQSIPDNPNQPSSWLVNVIDLEQASAVTVRTNAFALGWSPDGNSIVVAQFGTPNDGTAQALAINAASPTTTPTTLPGKMTVFLGFVKTA